MQTKAIAVRIRRTRAGHLRRGVREVYLRDDIQCGLASCPVCPETVLGLLTVDAEEAPYLLILSREVLERQTDFICDDYSINNCVIPGSALEELARDNSHVVEKIRARCRQQTLDERQSSDSSQRENLAKPRALFVHPNQFNRALYIKRADGETSTEYLRRQVFELVKWYKRHVDICLDDISPGQSVEVKLLVNSIAERNAAIAAGVDAFTAEEYVAAVRERFPLAGEKLAVIQTDDFADATAAAAAAASSASSEIGPPLKRAKRDRYEAHWKLSRIEAEAKLNRVFVGVIRMFRQSNVSGIVSTHCGDIKVLGWKATNRAIDGDRVAVRLVTGQEGRVSEDKFYCEDDVEDDAGLAEGIGSASGPVQPTDTSFAENFRANNKGSASASKKPDATEPMEPSCDSKYGVVVGIIRRHEKEHVGTLLPLVSGPVAGVTSFSKIDRLFKPKDPRIPDILIRTSLSSALENKRLLVTVDSWERTNRYPSGHYVAVLGDVGDPATETAAILHQHDVISREFSDAVYKCLPPPSYSISPEELARRADLRNEIVCSIDPPGCKDIDDALSCSVLSNGNYRVGVHIADVTHFVLPGTPLDLEAAERATTVYLVEKRTDMLPGLLTTDLCSLRANVERLTFSVLWEMTREAEIVKTEFTKAVICSKAALTYQEAQQMLDDKNNKTALKQAISRLNSIAKILRKRRMDAGALELSSLEVRFQLDSETQDPTDVAVYQSRDTNKLVEEFMLLANSSVASFTLQKLPLYAVLRRHPAAKDEALRVLQEQLQKVGIHDFKFGSSLELANSLNRAQRPNDPLFNRVIRCLATRCMNEAIYVCAGEVTETTAPGAIADAFHHYGLAADLYTHFTSPIRRYADVLVHRMLAVSLDLYPLPETSRDKHMIGKQCDTCNIKHRNAKWAAMASVEFFTYRYFNRVGPSEADAIVLSVKRNGLQLQIPRFGIETILIFKRENEPEYDALTTSVKVRVGEKHFATVKLFDHIWLRLEAVNTDFRPRVELTFLGLTKATKYDSYESVSKERKEFEDQIEADREGQYANEVAANSRVK